MIKAKAQIIPNLGQAKEYAILSGGTISATYSTSCASKAGAINSITNINSTDSIYQNNTGNVSAAIADANNIVSYLSGLSATNISNDLANHTFGPSVYSTSGNTFLNGAMTLTGDSSSVFIFNISDSLTVDSGASVILQGVQANHVFWVVQGNTRIDYAPLFVGNILSVGPVNIRVCHISFNSIFSNSNINITADYQEVMQIFFYSFNRQQYHYDQFYNANSQSAAAGNCNLIPNSKYEEYLELPYDEGQINFTASWFEVAPTPDYYHASSNTPNLGVPSNYPGPQADHSALPAVGAYAGIYGLNGGIGYEYIQARLLYPLIPNTLYYSEVYVAPVAQSQYSISTMGMAFTTALSFGSGQLTGINPQVFNLTLPNTRGQWHRISRCFTPATALNTVIIGNFAAPGASNYLSYGNGSITGAYYFIDDPLIVPFEINAGPDKTICGASTQVQLNASTCMSTVLGVTYNWTLISGSWAHQIDDATIINPTITFNTVPSYPVTLIYQVSLSVPGTQNTCSVTDQIKIIYNPNCIPLSITPEIDDACIVNGVSVGGIIALNVQGGIPPYSYQWSNGQFSQNISNIPSGTYTVTVTDDNGQSVTSSFVITDGNCCVEYNNPFPQIDISFSGQLIPPGNYDVNEDIIIPHGHHVTIENCSLAIGPGIKIFVRGTLLLHPTSVLFACSDQMWQGIIVHDNGGIQMWGTTIKDADIALLLHSKASGLVASNTFENNVVGVICGYKAAFNEVTNQIHVRENTFISNGLLKIPYPGQTDFGSKPKAGLIYFSPPQYVQIENNYFKELNSGLVIMNGSNPILNSNRFENIHSEGFYKDEFIGSALYAKSIQGGRTISITPSSLQSQGIPTFLNCDTAIQLNHFSCEIAGFKMQNVKTGIRSVKTGYFNNLNIHNNEIRGLTGIDLFRNGGATNVRVANNQIYMTGSRGKGINAEETNINSSSINLSITDNIVYVVNNLPAGIFGNNNTGINLRNIRSANVSYNHINELTLTKNFKGINMEGSTDCMVSCNRFIGASVAGPTAASTSYGMRISLSQGNTIACNTVDKTTYGIGFLGNCASSDFKGNIIKNHDVGLYLNNVALINQQVAKGNTWLTFDPATQPNPYISGFGAVNANSSLPNIVLNQFFVGTASGSVYNPIVPANNISWFGFSGFPPHSCIGNCNFMKNDGDTITALDIAIAAGDTLSLDWPAETRSIAEQYLFDKLYDHPYYLSIDPVLQSFYDTHQNMVYGSYNTVGNGLTTIENYNIYFDRLNAEIDSLIDWRLDSIAIIDSLRIHFNNNTLYTSEYTTLHMELVTLAASYANIEIQRQAMINQTATELQGINAVVLPVDQPAINQQIVNDIYLRTLAVGIEEFGLEDVNQLQSIAIQCPFSGGPAVYLARSIYLLIDASLEYDDDATCLIQGVFRQAHNTKIDLAEPSLVLMPNPATNNVEVQFSTLGNSKCKLILCDYQGKNIKTVNLPYNQDSYNFDLSGINAGIYIAKLFSGGTIVNTRKLSVIK